MSEREFELHSIEETLEEQTERTAAEFDLEPTHKAIEEIVELRARHDIAVDALSKVSEELRLTKDALAEAEHDYLTGALLFGPASRRAESMLDEIRNNRVSRSTTGNNNAALVFIDIEAMHTINNRHGHSGGDKAVTTSKTALVNLADYIRGHFRTSSERRTNPREDASADRRSDVAHEDIIGRRGGDELFVLMPFRETDDFDEEKMSELIAGRMNSRDSHDVQDVPFMIWGVSFFDIHKNFKMMQDEADPKANQPFTRRMGHLTLKLWRKATFQY